MSCHKGLGKGSGFCVLMRKGWQGGDDCHGLTSAAHAGLMSKLNARTRDAIRDQKALAFLHGAPSIFLNLWMAATKCMLRAAEDVMGSGFITAAGGNRSRLVFRWRGCRGVGSPRPRRHHSGGSRRMCRRCAHCRLLAKALWWRFWAFGPWRCTSRPHSGKIWVRPYRQTRVIGGQWRQLGDIRFFARSICPWVCLREPWSHTGRRP